MFTRFSNSWELVKASYRVLRSDKELIIFPIISFIGLLLVSAAFLIPMLAAGLLDNLSGSDGSGVVTYVVLFLFYVVTYTVTIFANTALVGAALIRMSGGDPTLRDGFNLASQRIDKIIGYALISATVGMVLRAISERAGVIGQIVIGIIGMAWNVATFLAVPVLVSENVGPIEAVKRSAALLKKTWGEQLVGNFSMGMIFGLIAFSVILLIVVPLFALGAASNSVALIALAVIVLVVSIIAVGLLSSTLSGIYQAALYHYAVGGEDNTLFDPELIHGAFKPKRG